MAEAMEVDDDTFSTYKEKLHRHLPFVRRMLDKVRGTPYEKKWQQMFTCIISDKKRLTLAQIDKMDVTISGLQVKMEQMGQCVNASPENPVEQFPQPVAPPAVQFIPPHVVAEPASLFYTKVPKLNKPPLSMDEIGDLLEENGGDDLSHINKEINEVKRSVEENKIKKAPDMDMRKTLPINSLIRNRDPRLAKKLDLNLNKPPRTGHLTEAQKAEAFYRRTMLAHGPQAIVSPPLATSSGSTIAAVSSKSMQSPTPLRTYSASKKFSPKPEITISSAPDPRKVIQQHFEKKGKEAKEMKEVKEREKQRSASSSSSSSNSIRGPSFHESSSFSKSLNSSNPSSSAKLNFKIPKLNRSSKDQTSSEKPKPTAFSTKTLQNPNDDLSEIQDSLKKKYKEHLIVKNQKRQRKQHVNRELMETDSTDEDYQPEPKKKVIPAKVSKTMKKVETSKKRQTSVEIKIEEKPQLEENVLKEFFSKLTNTQNCDPSEKIKLLGMLQNVAGGDLSDKIIKFIETKDEPSTSSTISTHDEDSCDSNKKVVPVNSVKTVKGSVKVRKDSVKTPLKDEVNEKKEEPDSDLLVKDDLLKPLNVKKNKKHKNELDRLNDDILNMFIRDDVLTATGKRLCTDIKTTKQGSNNERDLTPVRSTKSSLNLSPNISPAQRKQLDQVTRVNLLNLNLTDDDMPVDALQYIKLSVMKQEPVTPKFIGKSKCTARKRTMSKRPFTRTRKSLIEKMIEPETDHEETELPVEVPVVVKTPPKPKKPAPKRRVAWSKGIIKKKRHPSHKTGDMDEDPEPEKLKEGELEPEKLKEVEPKPKQLIRKDIKNTNLTIHAKNLEYINQCCLCDFSIDQKDTKHEEMVQHFVLKHEDKEVFISRLSPEDAKVIKENPMKITGPIIQGTKITFKCLLCPQEKEKYMEPPAWLNHIGLHTGEYNFKCISCDVRVKYRKDMKNVQHTSTCKQIFFVTDTDKSFMDRHLTGYMCDACNYVQLNEENLKNHVKMEHMQNDVKIIKMSLCNYSEKRSSIIVKDVGPLQKSGTLLVKNSELESKKKVTIIKTITSSPSRSTSNVNNDQDWEDDDGEDWEDLETDEIRSDTTPKTTKILELFGGNTDKKKNKKKSKKGKGKKTTPVKANSPPQITSEQKDSEDLPHTSPKVALNQLDIETIIIEGPHQNIQGLKISSVQGGQIVDPKQVYHRCDRTGFAIDNTDITYKCYACVDFTPQFDKNQRSKFLKHIAYDHEVVWNGYCKMCRRNVALPNDSTILDEFKHLEMVHIKNALEAARKKDDKEKDRLRLKKLPGDNLSGNSDTSMNTSGGLEISEILDDEPPATIIPKPSLAMIKSTFDPTNPTEKLSQLLQNAILKRRSSVTVYQKPTLKTDTRPITALQLKTSPVFVKPSSRPAQNININPVNMSPLPSISGMQKTTIGTKVVAILPNTPNLPSNLKDKVVYVSTSEDSASYQYDLHPWLPEYKCRKPDEVRRRMLQHLALCCTFKCMASTCSFYTSSSALFFDHLQCHQRVHPEDESYYNSCSYCSFSATDLNNLIGHVLNDHRYNKFQCPHCFFRSCAPTNLLTHIDVYHKDKNKYIMETQLPTRTEAMAMPMIMKSRNENVPPILCVFCKTKFFVMRTFLGHLRTHDETVATKCVKCQEKAEKQDLHKHLIRCHGFGLYQCIYCKFGTNSIDAIRQHLASLHYDHLPYACQRSPGFNQGPIVDNASVDSIHLMRVDLEVDPSCIHEKSYPSIETNNLSNVLKMADTKLVRRFVTAPRTAQQTQQNLHFQQSNQEGLSVKNYLLPKNTSIKTLSSQNIGTPTQAKIDQPNDPNIRLQQRIQIHPMLPPKTPVRGKVLLKPNIIVSKPYHLINNLNATKTLKTASGQTLHISEIFSGAKIIQQKSTSPTSSAASSSSASSISPSTHCNLKIVSATSLAKPTIPKPSIDPAQQKKIDAIVDAMVKDSGVENSVLYKCGMCAVLSKGSMSFFQHLQTHNALTFQCAHCKKMFNSEVDTTNHYNDEHLLKRFFCYFCYHKESNRKKLSEHMSRVHKIAATNQWPFNAKRNNGYVDAFALCPESVTSDQFKNFLENLIQYDEHRRKINLLKEKTTFKPSEIDLLPNTPIFVNALYCDECQYSCKVRLNLYRHLKQHLDGNMKTGVTKVKENVRELEYSGDKKVVEQVVAPKDDQMLATTKHVPLNERYKCNAKNCHYLSLDSEMFQSHLKTLHSKELKYYCPHCQTLICERMNVGLILTHLSLHGEKLFRCSFCSYYDSSAYAMRTHCKVHMEEDGIEEVTIETIRNDRSSIREQRVIPPIIDPPEPWKCESCNIIAPSRNEIIQHMVSVHKFRTQFKCSHCVVCSNSVKYFDKHFEIAHPDVYNLKVISMFSPVSGPKPTENVASVSTQPLWVRDHSKAKSIRGIFFDEETSSPASPSSTSIPPNPSRSELTDVTPANPVKSANAEAIEVRFGCNHCQKPFSDMPRLIKHWDIQHKNQIMVAQANDFQNRPGKPFRFHLQKLHGQEGPIDFLTDAFFLRTFSTTKLVLKCGICFFETCLGLEFDAHLSSKHNITNLVNNSARILKPVALKISADATITYECNYRTKTTVCKYSTLDIKGFAKHWRDHVAFLLYGCTLCTRTADTLDNLMEHTKEYHPIEHKEFSGNSTKFEFKRLEVSHPEMLKNLQECKIVMVNGLVLSLKEVEKTFYNPTKVIIKEIEMLCMEEFRKFQLQLNKKPANVVDSDDENELVIDEDPKLETSSKPENPGASSESQEVEDDLLEPMDESTLLKLDPSEEQDIDFSKVFIIKEGGRIPYNSFVQVNDLDPAVVIQEQCEFPPHQDLFDENSEESQDEEMIEDVQCDVAPSLASAQNPGNATNFLNKNVTTNSFPIISSVQSIASMDIDLIDNL